MAWQTVLRLKVSNNRPTGTPYIARISTEILPSITLSLQYGIYLWGILGLLAGSYINSPPRLGRHPPHVLHGGLGRRRPSPVITMRNTLTLVALLAATAAAYTDIRHKRFMVKNIDPIVLPGKYKSHMHSFYGSDVVTKDLPTTEQLQQGCASGENPNDLSVYWAPTLYHVAGDNYTEVNPVMFSTYYENIDKAEIPFPRDFYAVAGNASAKSQADVDESLTGITWWCENGPEDRQTRPRASLPRVTCGTHIQAILRFPDCVDPSDIKKYGYAAANGGRCAPGMKRMPQLRFSIRYDVRSIIPEGWTGVPPLKLACGDVSIPAPDLEVVISLCRANESRRLVRGLASMGISSTAGLMMRRLTC
ncbi:hypothetical protein B0H67DRAFT_571721 [Lasiosphaeris hirsuta]|uniref:DUF1996 domain-containing protein n=1 Tax=Lasiosphaeris hirsuta TaxID=260670 RepID=A0AA40B1A7_9PEZI|nr:hypothetical protein B0H67DRAFT_571721 [Lasiosphaeris hirsuta]